MIVKFPHIMLGVALHFHFGRHRKSATRDSCILELGLRCSQAIVAQCLPSFTVIVDGSDDIRRKLWLHGAVGSVPEVNQSVPDLCKFAAEMNPRSSTKESVLRIFTKFMCSLSGTEQLDFRDGHPATLHALFGLLIGDDVMLKMFAALI